MSTEADIDDLFHAPPGRFIAERDQLARKLKEDKEAATAVKRLRKPTLTAWALNELSRRHRDEVTGLLAAGESLRGAQRKAASGMKESGFQAATEKRRRAIRSLTGKGLGILSEEGSPSQNAEAEISRTLEAASVDKEAGDQLLQARLSKPIATVPGFDAATGFDLIAGGRPDAVAKKAERRAKEAAVRNAERQAQKAESEAKRARIRADTLAEQAKELSRRADEAEREASDLATAAAAAAERAQNSRGGS